LGPEISIKEISVAPADFHARFSAIWRRYRYVIDQSPAPDPLNRSHVWHIGRELDMAAMKMVADAILGEHDFGSFCKHLERKSNVRRVTEAHWAERGDGVIDFWIQANAFCQQMVRSVVGYSYDVGRGFSDVGSVGEVLEAGDRAAVATVAPPHGLVLWEVGYP
jgi:tRNA pseudouridine38-40 synthase